MIRSSSRSDRSSRGEAKLSPIPSVGAGLAERHLSQEPGQQEGGDREAGRGEEDRCDRRRERFDERLPDRLREVMNERRVRRRGNVDARRYALGELRGEPVREDRAEDRDADRAADLAEERRAGRGDPEHLVRDGVLGGENEDLHDQPEAEPEHEQVQRRQPERRRDGEPREEDHRRGRQPPCR